MNPIAGRVRNMINPYSSALTRWWRHSGLHVRLLAMITGRVRGSGPGRRRSPAHGVPTRAEMAARRSAIDALMANWTTGDED
jgi:hypothetical protein